MITHDVKLCIGGDNSKMRLVVKCHDTGVNLRVYLVTCRHSKWREINEPYYIPAGSTAVLKIAKPDKTFVLADGLIESDDILFELPPQAFTVAGVSEAEVSLFGADGRKVTSDTFNIDVSEECVCDGHEESETYVDIMAKQIEAANEAAKRAEDAAKRAEEAAGNGGVDDEAMQEAIAEYFTANPIKETDPTVSDWAKELEKPSYTADEVGALSAEALPEAINTALAQAKASGEFDGEDGEDGITPHIGENGNWYLGETDTGVKAQGEDGVGIIDIQKRTISGQEMLYIILSDGTEKDIKLPVPENGKDYVLTDADKQEIAELAADLVDVPDGDGVELDTTLTTSGKAADAKAVGDALNDKLSKSGGTMTGKIVFPTGDQNAGFANSQDMKIFGYGSVNGAMHMRMGDTQYPFQIRGNGDRPKYNNDELALKSELDAAVDRCKPVRGEDYWTDADKAEIKSYVDEAILGGAW